MSKRQREEIDFEDDFPVKREPKEVAIEHEDSEGEDNTHLGSEPSTRPGSSKQASKRSKSSAGRINDEGDTYFELGPKKRITVRVWKNNPLIDIREYWKDKDNTFKPGKKGISLTIDQFREILKYADEINDLLDSFKK
ncbi:Transcriptional coactivator [Actinomortierella wolfii]|nr:Transcriptional coactivator [Actinomortierella wolfii]